MYLYKNPFSFLNGGCMKKVFAFMIALLFASSAFAQSTVWFKGTFDEAKAKAAQDNKLLLTFFDSKG